MIKRCFVTLSNESFGKDSRNYFLNFLIRFRAALRRFWGGKSLLQSIIGRYNFLSPNSANYFSSVFFYTVVIWKVGKNRIWNHVWLNYRSLLAQMLVSVFVKFFFSFLFDSNDSFSILMYTFAIKLFLLLLDIVVNVLFHTVTLQHAAFSGSNRKENFFLVYECSFTIFTSCVEKKGKPKGKDGKIWKMLF